MGFFPVSITRDNQTRAVKMCFKCSCAEITGRNCFISRRNKMLILHAKDSSSDFRAPASHNSFSRPLLGRVAWRAAWGTDTSPMTAPSDTVRPLPPCQESIFVLFSLIRHTFVILKFWLPAPWKQLWVRCGQRAAPAGTCVVPWLNCGPNSPGHRAPQIIFPLN